ncbi:MAG: hypothetical protein L6R41_006424 [Letrouitia leprolyta]|nr:MAG: hypothetical protein L6R41_006424 [Letrouitia leprolyta]
MAATDCFTQVGDVYTVPSISTRRVSVGIDCPQSDRNTTCPLQTGGVITESRSLNITTDSEDKVFDAVRQATNGTFEESITSPVANFTYQVDPGTMGWYGFTPTLYCYGGTLGDCIGGDVVAGTAIEACEPRTLKDSSNTGFNYFDGTGQFVVTDDISNTSTNPALDPSAGSTAHMNFPNGILGFLLGAIVLWHLC